MLSRSRLCAMAAVAVPLLLTAPVALGAGFPVDNDRGGIPTLNPIIRAVTPAVVNIAVSGSVAQEENPLLQDPFFRRFFGFNPDAPMMPRQRQVRSAGSGVIIDAANGYLLTNHHVVRNADDITVTLTDGRQVPATTVGGDPETDIAVLKVDARNLTAIPFGDSTALEVGDFVIAVGNPFGLGQTVTTGIVSALGRGGLNIEGYEDFVQTDASINPGNSGGALVDMNGRLIGINTAIIGPAGGNVGIGFAVSVNMARAVMEQLVQYGEVRRGRIGVEIANITPQLRQEFELRRDAGVVVMAVEPGSSADRAGLRRGDVIVQVNAQDVRNVRELRNRLALVRAGERVQIAYQRGERRETAAVELVPDSQLRTTPAMMRQ